MHYTKYGVCIVHICRGDCTACKDCNVQEVESVFYRVFYIKIKLEKRDFDIKSDFI